VGLLLAGILLSLFAFGSSTVEVAVFGLASYAVMAAHRKRCGYIVFAGSFGYLIYIHATSASGETWKAGNIDITVGLRTLNQVDP
jgi:lysophospholipid acyltransferase